MRILAFALIALAFPAAAGEREAGIQSIIRQQIAAFRANDLERAFSFASPDIRAMFGNAQNFGRMVQQGYPMVWRPDDVRMGELSEQAGRLVQAVILRDATGALFIADYEMIEVGGAWRIDGVRIRRFEEAGI
ncbi:MAG TPA: DUF4864 domain-containing protein [Paracoccaceae bacterium]|nr:DUF4864 domain-containing protein [Paracoccaceae bacterium]